jgi:hypothetical protein
MDLPICTESVACQNLTESTNNFIAAISAITLPEFRYGTLSLQEQWKRLTVLIQTQTRLECNIECISRVPIKSPNLVRYETEARLLLYNTNDWMTHLLASWGNTLAYYSQCIDNLNQSVM